MTCSPSELLQASAYRCARRTARAAVKDEGYAMPPQHRREGSHGLKSVPLQQPTDSIPEVSSRAICATLPLVKAE